MPASPESIEKLLVAGGDLSKLSADERYDYYKRVCESLGLNPLTEPFAYLTLNGKLKLYARKDCTDQLRRIYKVSVDSLEHDHRDALGLYIVTATGSLGNRKDTSTGAVSIRGLTGDNLANAIMKAEAKAKRRLTLSLCGLGMLDETEIETISDAPPAEPDEKPKAKKENPGVIETFLKSTPEVVQNPDPQPVETTVTPEERRDWLKKLKVLGVETAALKKFVAKNYAADESSKLTREQMAEIVSKAMTAREKGIDQLNLLLDS